jgi:hypothetical protein
MNYLKIGRILKKLNFSFIVIFLLLGLGFLVIGVPLSWYDQYVIDTDKQCFKNALSERTDKWYITATTDDWREKDRLEKSLQDRFGEIAKNCNVSISYYSKTNIYSTRTIIDNSPQPLNVFYISLFFLSFCVVLKLSEKWITWLVKD